MQINQKREDTTNRKVGLGEFKVLAINPTREQLNRILGREDQESDTELTYTSENADGHNTVRITVWCEEIRSGFKTPVTFFLEDADTISRTGKTQYINAVGAASYVDSEDNLQDWFKKAMTYRVAKRGEEQLMNFMRSWLTGIELNVEKGGSRNNILLDLKRLFAGNFRELQELVNSEFAGTVLLNVTIKSKEVEENGETVLKQYQNVYNKAFLPGPTIRHFRTSGEKPRWIQKWVDEVNGEYGCKDYFVLEELRDYREDENPVSSNGAMVDDDPGY